MLGAVFVVPTHHSNSILPQSSLEQLLTNNIRMSICHAFAHARNRSNFLYHMIYRIELKTVVSIT